MTVSLCFASRRNECTVALVMAGAWRCRSSQSPRGNLRSLCVRPPRVSCQFPEATPLTPHTSHAVCLSPCRTQHADSPLCQATHSAQWAEKKARCSKDLIELPVKSRDGVASSRAHFVRWGARPLAGHRDRDHPETEARCSPETVATRDRGLTYTAFEATQRQRPTRDRGRGMPEIVLGAVACATAVVKANAAR